MLQVSLQLVLIISNMFSLPVISVVIMYTVEFLLIMKAGVSLNINTTLNIFCIDFYQYIGVNSSTCQKMIYPSKNSCKK